MARKRRDDRGDTPPTDDGWGTQISGTRPIAGAEPGAYPPPADAVGPRSSVPGRGRPWLIVLVSFLTQLGVVAAVGNTGVVDKSVSFAQDHRDTLGAFATLPQNFAWRLTPPARDVFRAYPAALFGLLALFVLAALFTVALVRGPVTFWRAFVGVWLSVVVATLGAGMVRRAVAGDSDRFRETGGKVVGVLFLGGGYEVMAGVLLGLVVALVAAVVAVVSRRPAQAVLPLAPADPAPYVEPVAPPPWHGDDTPPESATTQFEPVGLAKSSPADQQATSQFRASAPPAGTGRAPSTGAAAGAGVVAGAAAGAAGAAAVGNEREAGTSGEQQTTRFRREDVGEYGPPTVVGRDRAADTEAAGSRSPEPDSTPDRPEEPAPAEPARNEPEPTQALPVTPASDPTPASESTPEPTSERTPEPTPEPTSERTPEPTPEPTPGPDADPESTQAMPVFPRPPDDEDFAHHPDDD